MTSEQFDAIIEKLEQELSGCYVGSDEYKTIATELREFEKLRQSNETLINDYVRLVNEEEKSKMDARNEERGQWIDLGKYMIGFILVAGGTYLCTLFTYENPITNKSAWQLASTGFSRVLGKFF